MSIRVNRSVTFGLFLTLASVPLTVFSQVTFERAYGGTEWDRAYCVRQTTDGGYVVAGETESFGAGAWDVYLIRTDSLGDTLWTATYGGSSLDHGCSVQQTSDDGFAVAGRTYSFGAGHYDVYLIRTDSLGDTLWMRTYGDTRGTLRRCGK